MGGDSDLQHAWAPTSKGYVTLVSPGDSDLLAAHCWFADVRKNGRVYAGRKDHSSKAKSKAGDMIRLHKAVTGAVGKVDVDHQNRNGLDNRRPNLRPGTRSQNLGNQAKIAGTSSRYKGVCHLRGRPGKSRYIAYLKHEGQRYHLGSFQCEIQAARAYDTKARELWGEFARLNFPDERVAA